MGDGPTFYGTGILSDGEPENKRGGLDKTRTSLLSADFPDPQALMRKLLTATAPWIFHSKSIDFVWKMAIQFCYISFILD